MKLLKIVDEVFGDYKEAGMLLVFPTCTWKCEGCQNKHLSLLTPEEYSNEDILKRFEENPFTKCIIFGGLEPLCSTDDMLNFVEFVKKKHPSKETRPLFVIYTGYEFNETYDILLKTKLGRLLTEYNNVLIKFGRYVKNEESYFNDILGVNLASQNQKVISFQDEMFYYKMFHTPDESSYL